MAAPAQVTGERATRSRPRLLFTISLLIWRLKATICRHIPRGFVTHWHCALRQEATSRSFRIFWFGYADLDLSFKRWRREGRARFWPCAAEW